MIITTQRYLGLGGGVALILFLGGILCPGALHPSLQSDLQLGFKSDLQLAIDLDLQLCLQFDLQLLFAVKPMLKSNLQFGLQL